MAENENQQQDAVEGVVAEEEVMTTAKPAKQTLLWLAIIILLALLAGLSWFAYQEIMKQQATLETLSTLVESNQTDSLKSDISQFKQTLAKESQAALQQANALHDADASLAGKITEIAEMQQLTNDDVKQKWLLSEVKFLLQMANQRMLLAGDVENARTALILADHQLKELADPRLYQLRALLADEQLALAAVAKVDIDGLVAQLQSAIASVDTLKVLTGPEITMGQTTDTDTTNETADNWQAAASNAWQQVRSLVVIRHQQDGSSALIVPEQRYFLYQNLQLKLETARLALLSGRESLFNDSLAAAQQWLQQYFIGEERDALLQTVTAMQAETIITELPDISASLVWLQQKGEL
ncbi:MAG: uroporphyrinogen-III C-methyltransferase [Methylophaga sp.]|nr:uroporphyrinogen-III C-methyltransferase [Methylophaga sp.]